MIKIIDFKNSMDLGKEQLHVVYDGNYVVNGCEDWTQEGEETRGDHQRGSCKGRYEGQSREAAGGSEIFLGSGLEACEDGDGKEAEPQDRGYSDTQGG
jgi:hypothetical protein